MNLQAEQTELSECLLAFLEHLVGLQYFSYRDGSGAHPFYNAVVELDALILQIIEIKSVVRYTPSVVRVFRADPTISNGDDAWL